MDSVFVKPLVPLVAKEELDLERLIDSLVNNLSRIDVIRTEQAHILLREFRNALHDSKDLQVSKRIRGDLPRRKDDLAKFFTQLANRSKRDIIRTIALYDWLSKIDERLDGVSSIDTDIREKVISIIRQISVQNANTAVTDTKVQALNLRKKDDIIKSNGYTSLTSGSITNSLVTALETPSLSIQFDRRVYTQNIYTFFTEETTDTAAVGEKRYDTTQDALTVKISVKNTVPFNIIDLGLGIPFRIASVIAIDSANRREDITSNVVGNNISVNGNLAIVKTDTSVSDAFGLNTYNLIFPIAQTNVELELQIESFDTYPLKLYELVNARGEVIKSFSILESMIIDRRLVGETYASKKAEIDQIIATGYVREANNPSSLRVVEVRRCNVFSTASTKESKSDLNYLQSDLKIKSVELYVDVYDPLQLIRYYIFNAENEKQEISPVNSNPKATTKIVYETILPKQIQVEVVIPEETSYLPILHGIAVIIGEVNI